jgi:hypothetical protein
MASDPTQLMAMLAQNSGLFGQYFQEGQQQAQQSQLNDQAQAENAIKLQALQRDAATNASYQADVADLQANPSMDKVAALALKYPAHADAVKQFWAIKDPDARQSHISAIAQPLSAIENGRVDLAISSLQKLRDASATAKSSDPAQAAQTAADADELTQEIEALQSGDKNAINAVRANMMMHLAAADPEGKFADSLAKLKTSVAPGTTKGTVVGRAIGHYGDDGKWVVDYRDPDAVHYQMVDDTDDNGNPIKKLIMIGGDGQQASGAGPVDAQSASGSSQPLSVRLNNPGAIRFNPKNQWQGQTGQQNGFVQFDTPANGLRAHQVLIGNQIKNGYNTPALWAAHYAPASDGNNPAAYAQTIADGLGIGINDAIPMSAVPKVAALSAQVEAGGSSKQQAGASDATAPTAIVGASGSTTPGVKVLYTSSAPKTGLDAGTIEFYGQKVAAGGDLPQLGMGKEAAAMRQAILARSAQIQRGQGMTGGDSNLLHADVKTATTALAALQRTRNSLNPFIQTFDGASAQVRQLAPQAVGGSIPIFNRWIQAGRTSVTGDPAVSKFNVAINAVANENAKIMSGASGGAVTSDSARHEAMSLINSAQTLDQLYGALDQMHTDSTLRMKSLDDRQADLRGIIAGKGNGNAPNPSPQPAAKPSPKVGTVLRGFRFNGGNPADRNSWTKVQ